MLAWIELLTGLFLLRVSFLPFQNYEFMRWLILGGLALWLLFVLLQRNRRMLGTDLFFHFCLILSFHLRVAGTDGHLISWYVLLALTQWLIVLWFAFKYPLETAAPSVFLMICLISPLYLPILSERAGVGFWGIFYWILLPLRAGWILAGNSAGPLRIPWHIALFLFQLMLCGIGSLYLWNNVVFFLISCGCVLAYCLSRTDLPEVQGAITAGYLYLASAFLLFAGSREIFLLKEIGAGLLLVRHHILDHANTLGLFYLVLTCVLLNLAFHSTSRSFRAIVGLLSGFLAVFEFLTYSRNGWMSCGLSATLFLVLWARQQRLWRRSVMVCIFLAGLIFAGGMLFLPSTLKIAISERIGSSAEVQTRKFIYELAVHTIANHPLVGVGWLNHYSHLAQLPAGNPWMNLDDSQNVSVVRDHSAFLDLAEAGGIPLAALFLIIGVIHLGKAWRNPILFAGLFGIILNNLLDTASLWLLIYPHFWLLLGLVAKTKTDKSWAVPYPRAIITILFIAASVCPILEDLYLRSGFQQYLTHQPADAVLSFKKAGYFAPLDAAPLEQMKEVFAGEGNISATRAVLEQLTKRRKSFAPYYAQLGRLALLENKDDVALENLNLARRLDPVGAYRETTYLDLAILAKKQGRQTDFSDNLSLFFLLPQKEESFLLARTVIDSLDSDQLFQTVLEYAGQRITPGPDRVTAITNFSDNLSRLRKGGLSQRALESLLQQREGVAQDTLDYCASVLSAQYQAEGKPDRVREMEAIAGPGTSLLIKAHREMAAGHLSQAYEYLSNSSSFWSYADLAYDWQAYYQAAKQPEQLLHLYRAMQLFPTLDLEPAWQLRAAELYFNAKQFGRAAEEYHRLALFSYPDPAPHWLEARAWQLAGNYAKAKEANDRLQRLIQSTGITAILYRSDIRLPVWQIAILRASVPNLLLGTQWRTGILTPPPVSIIFPPDLRLSRIRGAFALIQGGWLEENDGATFELRSQSGQLLFSRQLDPKHNPPQRYWDPFDWRSSSGPSQVVLVTNPNKDASYDWCVWAIEEAD